MSITGLRPWTDLVLLHPDVEAGRLTESTYAIDLGAITENDPSLPPVYRDPEAFFRATYLTVDLRKMLAEVLGSLAGQGGSNRVLKLRTPFGGGKSHTLATLFHAARCRPAVNVIPEGRNLPDPGTVAVAVLDGEKFGALEGKQIPGGPHIKTMWGLLAWQIGPEAYAMVEANDQDRVAPGGDLIRSMLTKGAGGRPVLLLLDEVLKYVERAAAVPVHESTLQRQSKDFFQSLTVEVAGSERAVMVYSLQWSKKEALGNVALLQELDMLANRVDQLREPVTGDEILPILHRRLLGAAPDPAAASQVAQVYQAVFTKMRRANASDESQKHVADEEGHRLFERLRAGYPFHPALIDLMRERWTAVEDFQRTRGSLRLLATCLHVLKKHSEARVLLGPGEIPLKHPEVRLAILKELGARNDFDEALTSDILGENSRAGKIDKRIGSESSALSNVRPATRIATAILMYSFGGLRRERIGVSDPLPPGVTESELLDVCVAPDLDNITATAVLSDLRKACLYLHYDGVRYCFKKDPNVTKLVDDAISEVERDDAALRTAIKDRLTKRLAGHSDAVVWPQEPFDIPDKEPRFLVAYLPLDFASKPKAEQDSIGRELLSKYGDRPRIYRNGLCLAIPDGSQVAALRRAVAALLAIERVEKKKLQLKLTQDQMEQLRERKGTESSAEESAFRSLYSAVWLPRMEEGALRIELVAVGGRPLKATGVHERMMELLTALSPPKVHGKLTPRKIIERLRLGGSPGNDEPLRLGVSLADVQDAFFSFLSPPRLSTSEPIRKAVVQGIAESLFAYTSGATPILGPDGRYQVAADRLRFGKAIEEDEVDFESGFLIMPTAAPSAGLHLVSPPGGGTEKNEGSGPEKGPTRDGSQTEKTGPGGGSGPGPGPGPALPLKPTKVRYRFEAKRDQVFSAFPAVPNLADRSDGEKVVIEIQATSQAGFDPSWLRNAVEEPLDEANVEVSKE